MWKQSGSICSRGRGVGWGRVDIGGGSFHHAIAYLVRDVPHVAGSVGDEDGGVLGGVAEVLDGVEVLGHHYQVHHLLGAGARDRVGEVEDVVPEAVGDRLPLPRHANAAEVLGLGLGLGPLHHEDLLRLPFEDAGLPKPLGCSRESVGFGVSISRKIGEEKGFQNFAIFIFDVATLRLVHEGMRV